MRLLVEATRDALSLLDDRRRWKWAVLVVLAMGVTGLEAVGAMLIYSLVGLVSADGSGLTLPLLGDLMSSFPDTPARTLQIWVAVLVAGFFVVRGAVVIGQEYLQARVVHNAGAQVANRLVRGYLSMPYLFHTQRNSAELVRNAFDSAQRFVSQVLMPLVKVMAESLLVLGMAVVLLVVSPMATLLTLVGLGPALWLLMRIVQPRLKDLGRWSQTARSGSIQSLQQALGGFRDIRLLGSERHFATTFQEQRVDLARSEYLKQALVAFPRALIETALVMIIVIIFMAALLSGQGLESVAGTLGAFAYVGLRLVTSLRIVADRLNTLRFGTAVLDDLHADQARIDQAEQVELTRRTHTDNDFRDCVELQNVSFAYHEHAPWALQDVDVAIRRGEFLGLCGPTGGGKSTLVDLLVGLLEPTTGQVLVDGKGLRGREPWWHAQLGVVSQSVFLIDDTLRANIAFGRLDSDVDEAAVQRAVERAQLRDVIDQLPDGLDTVVGERGIRLSGGQRQRVAIARALYREPSVMVFDEGTSALDSATEAALVAALDDLKEGRTLIAVAHRISTVRDADRILVVEGGRISDSGHYDELLETSELFRSLAR